VQTKAAKLLAKSLGKRCGNPDLLKLISGWIIIIFFLFKSNV